MIMDGKVLALGLSLSALSLGAGCASTSGATTEKAAEKSCGKAGCSGEKMAPATDAAKGAVASCGAAKAEGEKGVEKSCGKGSCS